MRIAENQAVSAGLTDMSPSRPDEKKRRALNRRRLFTWPLAAALLGFSIAEDPSRVERLAKAATFAVYIGFVAFIAAVIVNLAGLGVTRTVNPFTDRKSLAALAFLVVLLVAAKTIGLPLSIAAAVMAFFVIRPPTAFFDRRANP